MVRTPRYGGLIFTFCLASLCTVTGCAAGVVKSQFVADVSCPSSRVTVTKLSVPTRQSPEPPADIAADPARAALFRESHPAETPHRFFVAEGCEKKELYECDIPALKNSEQSTTCERKSDETKHRVFAGQPPLDEPASWLLAFLGLELEKLKVVAVRPKVPLKKAALPKPMPS